MKINVNWVHSYVSLFQWRTIIGEHYFIIEFKEFYGLHYIRDYKTIINFFSPTSRKVVVKNNSLFDRQAFCLLTTIFVNLCYTLIQNIPLHTSYLVIQNNKK